MSEQTVMNYKPSGKVTEAFRADNTFIRGLMGPIGSGKSTACVIDMLSRAQQQAPDAKGVRRTRWAVIRNTYTMLKTTTIKTWHEWVPQWYGRWVSEGPPSHFIKSKLPDGTSFEMEVIFLALDSPQDTGKLLSLELTGAWVNEAREIGKEVLDALTGRVGRFPSKMSGGPSWFGIIMDTNPPDSDHWWYALAEELKPENMKFFRQPSGLAIDAENKENLPPRYYENITHGKSQEWLKVYVHGDYGFVMDGKPVFPEYKDGVHCKQCEANSRLPLIVGLDFGLTPAAVICQRKSSGQILVLNEIVTDRMGVLQFTPKLKAFMNEHYGGFSVRYVGDPAGDFPGQTDEKTPFMIMASQGIEAEPAETNDWPKRQASVQAPLIRMIDGEPGMLIDPKCVVLRKGFMGGYHYRRMRVAGNRFRDVPEKNMFSHVSDALQYAMLGLGEGDAVTKPWQSDMVNQPDVSPEWSVY